MRQTAQGQRTDHPLIDPGLDFVETHIYSKKLSDVLEGVVKIVSMYVL